MVEIYTNVTGDTQFTEMHWLNILDREHRWWMENRKVWLDEGENDWLNRYDSTQDAPRPESYSEDVQTNPDQSPEMFLNIGAACESGMDFSTRWLGDTDAKSDISTIETRNVVPVDLNTILYQVETILERFFRKEGDLSTARVYSVFASNRAEMIDKYLWDDEQSQWFDYDLKKKKARKEFAITNFMPAMMPGLYDPATRDVLVPDRAMSYVGGVPITFRESEQQWDFPNAWAPSTYFFSEALARIPGASELQVVQKWVGNAYCGYDSSKEMFEKYSVTSVGSEGRGGEYTSQLGFGWTNGVTLYYLNKFGDILVPNSCANVQAFVLVLTIGTVSLALLAVCVLTVVMVCKQCCCDLKDPHELFRGFSPAAAGDPETAPSSETVGLLFSTNGDVDHDDEEESETD